MKITREIDRKMDLRLSSLLALQDLEKMAILRHHFGTFLAWVPIFVWKNNEKNVIILEIVAKRDILWWKEFGLGVEACTSTMNWKFHHKFRQLFYFVFLALFITLDKNHARYFERNKTTMKAERGYPNFMHKKEFVSSIFSILL